jgi:RNAse (barnase) inhibitor barstar
LELSELINPNYKTIDLEHIVNIEHLHDTFAYKLNFPNFYGKNWDAFWDTITGLIEMPETLVLKNWDIFENKFKSDSKILINLINDFNKVNHNKKIEIITAGNNGSQPMRISEGS